MQYAPSAYPGLSEDITDVLELMLGLAEYKLLLDQLRKTLRSSTKFDQQFASQPPRQTPKYLRIIATRDDEQEKRLKAEWKGDVGVLQWEGVEQYLDSTADVVSNGPLSVA